MAVTAYSGKRELMERIDEAHAAEGRAQRAKLAAIADLDKAGGWIGDGARNMAEWTAARYGISRYRASKIVAAAHRLDDLPRTAEALATGALSLDKVVELTRFATAASEPRLVKWAKGVRPVTIRERAEAATRTIEDVRATERSRSLHFHRYEHDVQITGWLPSAEGLMVERAVEAVAKDIPASPEDEDRNGNGSMEARRADALVALAEARLAEDQSAYRPHLIVHAPLDALVTGTITPAGDGCATHEGIPLHPEIAKRLACDSHLEHYTKDGDKVIGHGRARRFPDPALRRMVEHRDNGRCTFPGCECKRFLHTHHSRWWDNEGPSDLYILHLACNTHHKLAHEFGWETKVLASEIAWFRPDGSRYLPEPRPPSERPPPIERADHAALWRAGLELRGSGGRVHPSVLRALYCRDLKGVLAGLSQQAQ